MRVLAFVHQPDAGPGVFAAEASERGVELEEWWPQDGVPPADGFDAALILGGAMHVDQEREHPWLTGEKAAIRALVEAGTPTLGVCLGAQLLAEAAGGDVGPAAAPEIGWPEVALTAEGVRDPLVGPLGERFRAFEWHSYAFGRPPAAVALASSEAGLQAFRLGRASWGIQFHAEVTEADARKWLDDYGRDEDARRALADPEALRAETGRRMAAWNAAGRALFGRFLDAAATRA